MSKSTYRRILLEGSLTLVSDLHIGTGETEGDTHSFNLVTVDSLGQPYIPGSSLRGLLASLIQDGAWKKRCFGDSRPASEAETQGQMGALRVYDAKLSHATSLILMSRTRIEAVTQTAMQHHLATQQLVSAGSQFKVELGFDHWGDHNDAITQEELHHLLAGLERLNGTQLGTGKSIGQGLLQWNIDSVQALSEERFLQWLITNMSDTNELSKLPYEPISLLNNLTSTELKIHQWQEQTFSLQALGPILIHNPHDPEVQKKNDTEISKKEKELLVSQAFLVKGDQAIIPGSTLKGWFRSQCRRILMTLAHTQKIDLDEDCLEYIDRKLLDNLFGGTASGEGQLRFYDATLPIQPNDIHRQTFNAIDRFTGGVKKGALYQVKGLWVDRLWTGRISYREAGLEGWMKLLLLFVWRDAQEGDLVLGWGKSKGYGRLQLQPTGTQWQWLNDPALSQWEKQLLDRLTQPIPEKTA